MEMACCAKSWENRNEKNEPREEPAPPLDLAIAGVQSGPSGFTNSWKGGQPYTVPHIHFHSDVKGRFSCCLFGNFRLFADMFGPLELNYPGYWEFGVKKIVRSCLGLQDQRKITRQRKN